MQKPAQQLTRVREGMVLNCLADPLTSCRHWGTPRQPTGCETEPIETYKGLCNATLTILSHQAKSSVEGTQKLYTEYLKLKCETVPSDSEGIIRSMLLQEGHPMQCQLVTSAGDLLLLSQLLNKHFFITERIHLRGSISYLLRNSSFHQITTQKQVQVYVIDRNRVTAVDPGAHTRTVLDNIVFTPPNANDKPPLRVGLNNPEFASIILEDLCCRFRTGVSSCDAHDLVYKDGNQWQRSVDPAILLCVLRTTDRSVTRRWTKTASWVKAVELHLVYTIGRLQWSSTPPDIVLMLPIVNAQGHFEVGLVRLDRDSELAQKAHALSMSDQPVPQQTRAAWRVPAYLCGIMTRMEKIRLLCHDRDDLPSPRKLGESSCCIACQKVPIRTRADEAAQVPDSAYTTPLDLRSLMIVSGE